MLTRFFVSFGLFSLGLTSPLVAQTFQITPINPLFGDRSSIAMGINDSGVIVGTSYDSDGNGHAFYQQGATQTALPSLGGSTSEANGISRDGQIVGSASLSTGLTHACYWVSGVPMDVDPSNTYGPSRGSAINSSGVLTGYYTDGSNQPQGFTFADSTLTTVNSPSATQTSVIGINDLGAIVGTSTGTSEVLSFIKSGGGFQSLPNLAGGTLSQANAINLASDVAGWATNSSGNEQAVIWRNLALILLGDLGGSYGEATAINNFGQVVGASNIAPASYKPNYSPNGSTTFSAAGSLTAINDSLSHAFLWQNGSFYDLNSFLPGNSGWVLQRATGINNAGQIVGYGTLNGVLTGFVLTPVLSTVTGAGALSLSQSAYNTINNNGTITLTVTRTGGTTGKVSAQIATVPGTASAYLDFTPVYKTVTFAAGQGGSQTLAIPIIYDAQAREEKSFTVSLFWITGGAAQGPTTQATVTLQPEAVQTPASVMLGNLAAAYNGKPHAATATTVPPGLPVTLTYNGSATVPILAGNYGVVATINNANYSGSASGTLVISAIPPLTTTYAATKITASSATLNGVANPDGSAALVYFQYGTTNGYGYSTGSQDIASGTASMSFSADITLAPQTRPVIYHYRAVTVNANNAALISYGADKTFTALAESDTSTAPVIAIGATNVEVSESVIPDGVATMAYFRYGTTTAYGSQTAAQNVGAANTAVNVFAILPDLTPGQTYYYQMVTTSAAGTFYGPPESFVASPDVTTPVVQTGTAATGVAGAVYSVLANPIINDANNVAFAATMTGTGVTAATNSGIWLYPHAGTPQLVVRTGITPAPLTLTPASTYGTFATLGDPVYNNNETVAFRATLKVVTGEATSATALGIWSSSGGSLSLVARQGSPAPGYPSSVTFSGFTSLALPDQGGPVFIGTLNTNAAAKISGSNNVGMWQVNSGTLHLVVSEGAVLNGKTVTALQFLPALPYVNGQNRSFTQTSGDLTFIATFSDKTTGVFKVVAGTPQPVALESGAPAGVASAEFLTFGNPAINAHDHTAFAATMVTGPGGVTTANNTGIWADDNTELVARMGITPAPLTLPPVSGYGLFATMGDPVYDDTDAVAFRATLKVVAGQATSSTATGIWSNASGSLDLVAREGTQAAGCPPGATFSTFTELALPNQGGVVFLASLNTNAAAAVTGSNNQGIWAVDTNDNLQLIVRTGDIINGKTITALKFLPALSYVNGQTRSFTQSVGDLTYEATFSDNSTGIFTVTFP